MTIDFTAALAPVFLTMVALLVVGAAAIVAAALPAERRHAPRPRRRALDRATTCSSIGAGRSLQSVD
jgi:hypothetical protein